MTRIIRVFPRKTSMTPTDAYTFVGEPQLWRPEAAEVHVSVTFTWDIPGAERLARSWARYYDTVKIGGPAIDGGNGEFVPGFYVRNGVTFTSRGCVRNCPWCLVPKREGQLKLLPITSGWIVQDNNLLATPRDHQRQVYEMLRAQGRRIFIPGGLDARLVDSWVADQLRTIRIGEVFLAADTDYSLDALRDAVERLNYLTRRQLRCYVMIGYNGETIPQATRRLEAVWSIGCLPFAQLYQPPDRYIEYSREWRKLARIWSRPAAMFALHNAAVGCGRTTVYNARRELDRNGTEVPA